jgi:hypothetical protein
MKEKEKIEDGIGKKDWSIFIGLIVEWVKIFMIVIRGMWRIGKVYYFIVIFN